MNDGTFLQVVAFWLLFAALMCLGLAGGGYFFAQGFAWWGHRRFHSLVDFAVTLAIWGVTGAILAGLLLEVSA
ncbi:hypothetical protein [Demequina gelatinilytica]|uniref:hypothetical protein n=1 Tax=Demequina gelatinilytica TaxID=1638980 RepID=UPI000783F1C9|nr:hypothetical protein [Demequina gelatinilytica]